MATGKEILKVALLARLELTEEERGKFGSEFEKITAYFAELQKMGISGELVLPYSCPLSSDNPREYDIKLEDLTRHIKDGQVLIPPWLA